MPQGNFRAVLKPNQKTHIGVARADALDLSCWCAKELTPRGLRLFGSPDEAAALRL